MEPEVVWEERHDEAGAGFWWVLTALMVIIPVVGVLATQAA